jgi:hypothetical protein
MMYVRKILDTPKTSSDSTPFDKYRVVWLAPGGSANAFGTTLSISLFGGRGLPV